MGVGGGGDNDPRRNGSHPEATLVEGGRYPTSTLNGWDAPHHPAADKNFRGGGALGGRLIRWSASVRPGLLGELGDGERNWRG